MTTGGEGAVRRSPEGPGPGPVVVPFGDAAVLVELGEAEGADVTGLVHALAARIRALVSDDPGWAEPVSGASSVLVAVDPVDPGAAAAARRLGGLVAGWWADEQRATARPGARRHPDTVAGQATLELAVRYGGADGPDLGTVAEMTGLSTQAVVELHAATTYVAGFLGFAPGFAYLGPLAPALVLPRRPVPRASVPTGSVAIAGPQTAVYPVDSPGGWWLLGRTDAAIWDPRRDPPALIRAGMRVRFVPAGRVR